MPFITTKFRAKVEESGRSALSITKAAGFPYSTIARLMQRGAISGHGTATAGSDYVPTNGIMTFLPGQTNQTITVKVMGDFLKEPDEPK